MPYRYVEDADFPIVIANFPREPGLDTVAQFFAEIEACLDAHDARCAIMTNLTHVNPLKASAKERKLTDDAGKKLRPKFDKYLIAEARVVPNATLRGALVVIDWLDGAVPWKRTTVASYERALAWLKREAAV